MKRFGYMILALILMTGFSFLAAPASPVIAGPITSTLKKAAASAAKKGDVDAPLKRDLDADPDKDRKKSPLSDLFGIKAGSESEVWMHVMLGFLLIAAVFSVLLAACFWRIFEKAGEHGFQALIPFYNIFVMQRVADMPKWSFIVLFLPAFGGAWYVWFNFALAKAFGRSPVFAIGLTIFPMFYFPMLAFGNSQYKVHGTGQIPYRMVA